MMFPTGLPQSKAPAVLNATVVPAGTGSNVSQHDAQMALDYHNAKRREVGVPALEWSTDLASVAQKWANHLVADGKCHMQHSTKNVFGENLFAGSGTAYTALSASETWYAEIKDYTPGVPTGANRAKTGHYTQMVWANTKQVGIGQATCGGDGLVIVAEYDPAGNMMGEKPY